MTEYVKHIKNVPVFYTEHDMSLLDFNQSFHDRDLDDTERFFEWKKLVNYEKKILDYFHSVIVLTERDKSLIENLNSNVKATIIPTGVDTDFYTPNDYTNNDKNLVFVGHYRHFPNADAIVYFVKNIYPKVLEKNPNMKLYVVGSGVTKTVEELKNGNIVIVGEVDDIRQYLKRPNIFIAPVRLGGGIKGKVLEAMAMGVPVVATKEAVSGIDYSVGDFALISDDTKVFADNIVRLYNDDALYKTLSNNSRKIVEENYNWKIIAEKLNDFYLQKMSKK
jgi:glycosyltransferase involved in cell wall biosynthesis